MTWGDGGPSRDRGRTPTGCGRTSTQAVAYAESSSLELLLLVDPDARRIEVARPAAGRIRDWQVYGAGDLIATPYGDIDVDACYDAVDRTATAT